MLLNLCQYYDVRAWQRFEEMGMPPDAFIGGGPALWEQVGINERCRGVMASALSSGLADRELDACDELGVRVITCRDALYPPSLLEIPDAPLLLYVKGNVFLPNPRTIAVVGTRRCSQYGSNVARDVGRGAAARGLRVVSGGAKGIDGAAHGGCIEGGGVTAAVLGTGVDVVYPSEHGALFGRIMENGALYSEYPLGSRGEAWRFPRRNRIIVGLASRVAVIEAPNKSGAMITARLAAEAGREVWAAPGRIDDARCAGSNLLIFDGAMPLIALATFFEDAKEGPVQRTLFDDGTPEEAGKNVKPAPLSEAENILMALLTNQGDRTIDNLAGEAKMSAAEVFKIMSVMSLRGLVYLSGPGRYRIVD
jgi:DNA processing protein